MQQAQKGYCSSEERICSRLFSSSPLKLDMNITIGQEPPLAPSHVLSLVAWEPKVEGYRGKQQTQPLRGTSNRIGSPVHRIACRKKKPLKQKITFWEAERGAEGQSLKPLSGSLNTSNAPVYPPSVRFMQDGQRKRTI